MGDNKRGTGTKVVHSNKTHKRQTMETKDKETSLKVAPSNSVIKEIGTKKETQRKREQRRCS
jgi:hypothetical protein